MIAEDWCTSEAHQSLAIPWLRERRRHGVRIGDATLPAAYGRSRLVHYRFPVGITGRFRLGFGEHPDQNVPEADRVSVRSAAGQMLAPAGAFGLDTYGRPPGHRGLLPQEHALEFRVVPVR